jgi:hypothetical protein
MIFTKFLPAARRPVPRTSLATASGCHGHSADAHAFWQASQECVINRFRRAHLWVPKTSSTSCDQAIFVDQVADASLSSGAVPLRIDRLE